VHHDLLKLATVTAEQWGLITPEQAAQAGVPPLRLAALADAGLFIAVGEGQGGVVQGFRPV